MGDNYQPNQTVLANLPEVTLLIVVGPTAVGKTTLVNTAVARCPALHPVLTTTSRPARAGEENDIDFHFRSREEIEARKARGEYVQVAVHPSGEYYATAPEDYSVQGVAIMAVMADAMPVFKALPFKNIRTIFVLPASWEQWQQQLKDHQFTPEQREKRLAEARRSLRYAIDTPDLAFVINDDIIQSSLEFTQIALGAAPAANEFACRDLAATLLKELQNR
ncbi:MAG TPA: hypothetical protein VFM05_12645 [Candidatus Saccharimonadales bacterium]|nr:hypothetical protein [Candidatus Saccharimonadales bacterium]